MFDLRRPRCPDDPSRPRIADRELRRGARGKHGTGRPPWCRLQAVKSARTIRRPSRGLLKLLSQHAIDRHSFTIAIGGGAVLDAVGYASAIFHRGVRHIRFPTTVLAQDDSGVGVKNAVNLFGLKNLIGTFAPPWAIINDSSFIDMLPPREKRAGMAEAVKVALIRDGKFFNWLEANADELARFSTPHLDHLIKAMRRTPYAPDPARRRSFRNGIGAPARFWSLVGAQARAIDEQ